MNINTDDHFKALNLMRIPARRAAYSDRTAWLMAIMAQLAYTRLDEETPTALLGLAKTLAGLTDAKEIEKKLADVYQTLASLNPPPREGDSNEILRSMLKAGNFELLGAFHSAKKDTQGFVARRVPDPNDTTDLGMAVLVFRGTQQIPDWVTNINISPAPVQRRGTGPVVGNMHRGFHDAYMSVHDQIRPLLAKCEKLPLYITGHSLGGALAVTATWFQES